MRTDEHLPCLGRASVLVLLAVGCLVTTVAWGASDGLSYQGTLADGNGTVIADGAYAMRFTIFTTATGGPAGGVWQESHASVETRNGAFAVELGLSTLFETLFQDESMLWLEVEVDRDADGFEASEIYAPRVSLSAAPYVLSVEPYTDDDAVAAMGTKDDANPLNHDRFTDPEAVAAMGTKDDANPLNHDKYELADGAVGASKLGTDLRVAFRAHLSGTTTSFTTSVVCDVEDLDTRDSYDPSTGVFTAPYDGVYLVCFTFAQINTSSAPVAAFAVNGTYGPGISDDNTGAQNSASAVLQLSAGDVVSIKLWQGTTLYGDGYPGNLEFTHFSGFRIF